ncbi:MAG: hypothetical protein EA365_10005 [Gloeocapsa sp. DLM2.Bin57]|nr:MAG: hypothetical protein EA365_10005 [Gloeocapsa sp. DLM2.Bin57]
MDNSSQAKSIELLQTTINQLQTILEEIKTNPPENLPKLQDLESLYNSSQNLAQGISLTSSTQPQQKSWLPLLLGGITAIAIIAISIWILKLNSPVIVTEITDTTEITETIEPTDTTDTTEIVETPLPKIITPIKPEPVIIPTQPSPQLEIIPEQGLIAAIQTEVGEITDKFTENLINLVEADFLKSLLIIQVTEDWYQLTPIQQQEMANQILSRSQVLNFRKLEIRDNQGVTLARNPVVGKNMVMIQRQDL